MGVAELGVKISLMDSASAGFGSLALGLGGIYGAASRASSILSRLNDEQKVAGGIALASGALFAGFAGALKWAVDNGSALQDAMMRVSIAVDGADQNAEAMKNTVINLADYSVFSLAQVADGFVALGEKGQDAKAIMGGVGAAAINLSEALNTQVVPGANLLATSMQLFGAKASDATHYADLLTSAFYHGIPSVSGLQQAVTNAGGMAAAAGVKFDDFVTVLDVFGRAMGDGSKAGTSLRYAISAMTDPVHKGQLELADLGILVVSKTAPALLQLEGRLQATGKAGSDVVSNFDGTLGSLSKIFAEAQKVGLVHTDETFFQWSIRAGILSDKLYDAHGNFIGLAKAVELLGQKIDTLPPQDKIVALQQLFNARSGQGIDTALQDIGKLKAEIDDLHKKQGNTSAATDATKVTGTLSGVTKELGTTFQSAGERIGSATLGPLTGVGTVLNNLVHAFVAAPSSVHTATAVFLVVGTVLSGLVFVISSVVLAVGVLGPVFMVLAGPVGIVIGVIVGLAIVIGVLVANWGKISAALKPVGDLFHTIGTFIQNTFVKAFNDTNSQLKVGQTLWPLIHDAVHQVQIALGSMGTLLKQLTPLWDFLGVVIKVVAAMIGFGLSILVGVFMALLTGGKFVITGLIMAFSGLLQFVIGFVQFLLAPIIAFFAIMKALFTGHAEQIPKIFIGMFSNMGTAVSNMWSGLWHFVVGILIGTLGALIGYVVGFIGGFLNFFGRLWDQLPSGFRDALGKAVNEVGSLPGKIGNVLSGLPGQMMDFGRHAIQMLIDGINSKLNDLKGVVGNVGQGIKNILGFNSPPKEGPLADSDNYMPNMMQMYATGILQHKHLVHGAMNEVSAGMSVAAHVTASGVRAAAASGAGSGSGNNTTPLQITVDGKVVADVVLNHVTGELKQVGASRLHR